ncbi:MAG: YqaA family protein [Desulfuromonadales bacterium]|uniref:YqaA family protein n=1 Tax=Desulfuromonas sp. KJ2020 TaxID=2919173 RepID=UPI0020A710A2|nr:VTT domain-containing protein [Desulfuromonas sp. KJ2020]
MHLVRRLYDWVLHWAYTPFGAPALFLLAFAESSFFPIPPDVLLLALCISVPAKSFRFALICSLGSVLGGMGGYGIGMVLWEGVSGYFYAYVPGFTPQVFHQVQNLFSTYDFWAIFAAGFTPIPYKVFTIGAGVFDINFPVFVLASAVGRSLRFFLVAWLIFRFGPAMRAFIEKYFNLLTIVFVVLLVGGFIVIRHLL